MAFERSLVKLPQTAISFGRLGVKISRDLGGGIEVAVPQFVVAGLEDLSFCARRQN